MHLTLRLLTFSPLWLALTAAAQTPTTPAEVAATLPPPVRIERITHEDAFSRIDELRVGGRTQHIGVQPKNGAPAYEIQTDLGQPAEPPNLWAMPVAAAGAF